MSIVRGKIENGRRVEVKLPFYSGQAGMRVHDNLIELAFAAEMPSSTQIKTGSVDGDQVEIIKIAPSSGTRGFLVVSCRLIG